MNVVRCANCGHHNSTTENFCLNCGAALAQSFRSYQPLANLNPNVRLAAPLSPTLAGKVWMAYIVYCTVMALTIFMVTSPGLLLAIVALFSSDEGADAARVVFGTYSFLGLAALLPFAVAPFLPKKSGAWIYGVILLCLGSLTCVALPVTIPLFVFWFKPETELFFNRPVDR